MEELGGRLSPFRRDVRGRFGSCGVLLGLDAEESKSNPARAVGKLSQLASWANFGQTRGRKTAVKDRDGACATFGCFPICASAALMIAGGVVHVSEMSPATLRAMRPWRSARRL